MTDIKVYTTISSLGTECCPLKEIQGSTCNTHMLDSLPSDGKTDLPPRMP